MPVLKKKITRKKLIGFEDGQLEAIEERAGEMGISASELIRRTMERRVKSTKERIWKWLTEEEEE